MREIDKNYLYPALKIHCTELDQMFTPTIMEVGKYQCSITLPANPTYEDKVYHFHLYANDELTQFSTTVTVLGRLLVDEYHEVKDFQSFPDVLGSAGGECIIIVNFNEGGNITPVVRSVWGVRIDTEDSNPATCITPTDDLLDMNISSFGERPCLLKNGEVQYYLDPNDFTKKADGTNADITSGNDGDVMIEIPRMAWFVEYEGNTLVVKLTNYPYAKAIDSRFKYLAHTRDEEGDCDYIYIGAYQASELSGRLRSLSGKLPLINTTIGQFRDKAQINGTGYGINRFYLVTLLQIMYLMKYQNLNSQIALGQGVSTGDNPINTGGTEDKSMYWGSQNQAQHVKFAGIEDWYGNVWDRFDGVYTEADLTIKTAFKDFNDTGDGYTPRYTFNPTYQNGNFSNNYMVKPVGTTELAFFAKEATTETNIHFCDYHYISGNKAGGHFGGRFGQTTEVGAFNLSMNIDAATGTVSAGSRLVYLPN